MRKGAEVREIGDAEAKLFARLRFPLQVQAARGDNEDAERTFDEGKRDGLEGFAEAGFGGENEAVVESSAGKILELELFEFKHQQKWWAGRQGCCFPRRRSLQSVRPGWEKDG